MKTLVSNRMYELQPGGVKKIPSQRELLVATTIFSLTSRHWPLRLQHSWCSIEGVSHNGMMK